MLSNGKFLFDSSVMYTVSYATLASFLPSALAFPVCFYCSVCAKMFFFLIPVWVFVHNKEQPSTEALSWGGGMWVTLLMFVYILTLWLLGHDALREIHSAVVESVSHSLCKLCNQCPACEWHRLLDVFLADISRPSKDAGAEITSIPTPRGER